MTARRGGSTRTTTFVDIEVEEYTSSSTLTLLMRDELARTVLERDQARRRLAALQSEISTVREAQSDLRLAHAESEHTLEVEVSQLKGALSAANGQISDARSRSFWAVILAWVGMVLAAVGVNWLTGVENRALGMSAIGLALLLEIVAMFVRDRRSIVTVDPVLHKSIERAEERSEEVAEA